MSQPFDDVRLPEDIEIGAKGGPSFQTTVVPMGNGTEQRNADWVMQRNVFDVGYGIQSLSDVDTARAFFYGRRGRWRSFRFKDWQDFNLDNEVIGTGNAVTTAFQIIKTYDSTYPYVRNITRPVQSTVRVYKDGALQTLTTHYTLGTGINSGVITFLVAPGMGVVITVTCEFDVPVRFDTDTFELTHTAFEAGEIMSLLLIEDRDE